MYSAGPPFLPNQSPRFGGEPTEVWFQPQSGQSGGPSSLGIDTIQYKHNWEAAYSAYKKWSHAVQMTIDQMTSLVYILP